MTRKQDQPTLSTLEAHENYALPAVRASDLGVSNDAVAPTYEDVADICTAAQLFDLPKILAQAAALENVRSKSPLERLRQFNPHGPFNLDKPLIPPVVPSPRWLDSPLLQEDGEPYHLAATVLATVVTQSLHEMVQTVRLKEFVHESRQWLQSSKPGTADYHCISDMNTRATQLFEEKVDAVERDREYMGCEYVGTIESIDELIRKQGVRGTELPDDEPLCEETVYRAENFLAERGLIAMLSAGTVDLNWKRDINSASSWLSYFASCAHRNGMEEEHDVLLRPVPPKLAQIILSPNYAACLRARLENNEQVRQAQRREALRVTAQEMGAWTTSVGIKWPGSGLEV
jgi:hypothetical protein